MPTTQRCENVEASAQFWTSTERSDGTRLSPMPTDVSPTRSAVIVRDSGEVGGKATTVGARPGVVRVVECLI